MKNNRKRQPSFLRRTLWMAGTLLAAGAFTLAVVRTSVPDIFYVEPGTALTLCAMPWLRPYEHAATVQQADAAPQTGNETATLALFGVLPIKTVRTVATQRRSVTVCGTPFGIKMFANGALVVGFTDSFSVFGGENPSKQAGLRLGDLIVSADGRTVHTNQQLADAIAAAGGRAVHIVYLRGETEKTCLLQPVEDSANGAWRAGVWVRDSSAGIGTLTFADAAQGTFAGLGHAISDIDTGTDMPLLAGEIVPVRITGCVAGAAGSPGELRGEFDENAVLGRVCANDVTGVYGVLDAQPDGESYPVANIQEVQPGAAQIMATLEGNTPKLYEARIEKVSLTAKDPNRNMLVRVTDTTLLAKTGGIVQGMSGSPILQDGKLVGAVTHVLVNDPARGYAIFAQTMMEKADAVARDKAA